jgi:hypothetical protein
MTDSIIDNDIHTNANPNDTMDIDIFAPPPPSPEDEMSTTLKRELDVLRVQLRSLVQNVPAEAAGITDFEDWCQRWTDMTVSDFPFPSRLTNFTHVQIGFADPGHEAPT